MPLTRVRPLQPLPGDVLVGEWQELPARSREQGMEERDIVIDFEDISTWKKFCLVKISVLKTSLSLF